MDREEIRDKISSIVWNINSDYSPSGAETTIMEIIDKVWEEAYREGFKAAKEKNPSIGEVRITPDSLDFIDLMEDEHTDEKMLYLYETDELTKAAGIYTDTCHNDIYQVNFYGVESKDNFK